MSIRGNKTRNPGYQHGNHWVECARCGFNVRSSDTVREWTGSIVCRDEAEVRHPQDTIRSKSDQERAVGLVRSESPEVTQDITYTCLSRSAIPNVGLPDCMYPSNEVDDSPLPVSGL